VRNSEKLNWTSTFLTAGKFQIKSAALFQKWLDNALNDDDLRSLYGDLKKSLLKRQQSVKDEEQLEQQKELKKKVFLDYIPK
jgi:hypothetical protein